MKKKNVFLQIQQINYNTILTKIKLTLKMKKKYLKIYFKEFDLIESGWLLTNQNWENLTYSEWIEFENNFEFILKQHRGSAHCNCIL